MSLGFALGVQLGRVLSQVSNALGERREAGRRDPYNPRSSEGEGSGAPVHEGRIRNPVLAACQAANRQLISPAAEQLELS